MTYYPHSQNEINQMLKVIGVNTIHELKKPIPAKYLINDIKLDEGKSELEVFRYFDKLAGLNANYEHIFAGCGAYNHYIPAVVDEISSRQEFYTAYTPYQAEVSQGTLRIIFEYQTYMCLLTGLDVCNASMYDGATSLAESILMAVKSTGKNKVLIDRFTHPEYIDVVKTYLKPLNIEIVFYESDPYIFNINDFKKVWDESFSAFVISSPNYCGSIIDFSGSAEIIHSTKSLLIQNIQEAMSLVIFKSPSDYGVDIACGEAQSFGIPLSFGGPYLGFISCKKELVRRMPGRLAGQTVDKDGNIAYILTLSTREQHIRREGATSNICSNHGLCAIRASIYLTILGNKGLQECALKNIENSIYLKKEISKLSKFRIIDSQVSFNEFTVYTELDYSIIKDNLEKEDILSFIPLDKLGLKNHYIVCTTEMNTKDDIDCFVNVLRRI
jgi:glycine dehydrogenase subunit 1